MSLSFSSIFVGLAAGAALGYSASQFVQRDDSQSPLGSNSNTSSSSSAPNRAKLVEKSEAPVKATSATTTSKQDTNTRFAPSPMPDLNSLSLKNYQPYANGFRAELALMNAMVAQILISLNRLQTT